VLSFPAFLHIFFENVILELCNCYIETFLNSNFFKFFSIFVTCHHLHYFVWYESKKLWWLDNAKMLSIFSNRVNKNFSGIYELRLVRNYTKTLMYFKHSVKSQIRKWWLRKLCVIVSWDRSGRSRFSFQNYFTATVQNGYNILLS